MFLRAVVNRAGEKDILDQLDDEPKAQEKVYVYVMVASGGTMHVRSRIRGMSGFYASAEYEWLEDVDGELLRDNQAWHEWVVSKAESLGYTVDRETGKAEKEKAT